MIHPYYVIRIIFWIFVFICLFILLIALIVVIEYASESLIMNILANTLFLGIIVAGTFIADNTVMYQIDRVENNNSNDEISGPQHISAFINKQMYLFPLYMYIAIFALMLAYFLLYIIGVAKIDKILKFLGQNAIDTSSHNFSKIITSTIISMYIIVPVHFISVLSYQVLRGKQQIEQIEHVKDNYKKIKHLTMFLVIVTIFVLIYNIKSFHAWRNLKKIQYKNQENFELSYNWTSIITTIALFVLVAFVQNLARSMN